MMTLFYICRREAFCRPLCVCVSVFVSRPSSLAFDTELAHVDSYGN